MGRKQTLTIRVPASTANLGPGYDALGLAVDLFNDFHVTRLANGRHRITGTGACAGLRAGGSNVFFRSYKRVCRLIGERGPALSVEVAGRVPVARGLGSSSTAIVAGAMAANQLFGAPLAREELLKACTDEEGHPDNVAPALMGSLTASAVIGDKVVVHQYPIDRRWRLAMLVPDYELETHKARSAIPKLIAHQDAVFNLSRIPHVIDALVAGDAEELRLVLEDRLHEPYRKKLIHGYDAIRTAATEAGAAAVYLSGAGPTMAAFCLGARSALAVAGAMADAMSGESFDATSHVLKPEPAGARVLG